MLSEPFWIGGQVPLAAWSHLPDDSTVRATVVACGPALGEDATKARMAFLGLAEALVEAGIGLIRFDYPGRGNSADLPPGAQEVDMWRSGISRAVDLACATSEAPCILVGMRLGATLAWETARRDSRVQAVVLWDPVFDGQRYLRAQQAFVAAIFGVKQPADGEFVGPGYVLDRDAVASLTSLRLEPHGMRGRTVKTPTLIATQRGEKSAQRQLPAFLAGGCEVVALEGQSTLMELPPHEVRLHRGDLEKLVAWISTQVSSRRFGVKARPEGAAVVGTVASRPVEEQFLLIGPTPLFGVETSPTFATLPKLTVVFLSAGALENFGPGRLWAETARTLASHGVRSLRVDNSGVGDTPARSQTRRGEMLHPDALSDLDDIAAAFGARDGGGLVFVGLSSGAYHAAEAGLTMRPEGVCLINGSVAATPSELRANGGVDARRRAYRPMPAVLERMARSHKRTSQILWKTAANFVPFRAPEGVPGRIAARGTRVAWIATKADSSAFAGNLYWRVREMGLTRSGLYRRYRFRFDDHPLYTPDTRRLVKRILVEFVLDAKAGLT
ncbi:MAG: serine aminopeptidase domain-containing protein [Acidimicrobiales bacterium]